MWFESGIGFLNDLFTSIFLFFLRFIRYLPVSLKTSVGKLHIKAVVKKIYRATNTIYKIEAQTYEQI